MAPTKKRSPRKKTNVSTKNKLAKGVGLGVGLTALVAVAYKQGLFDKLADQIRGNTGVTQVNHITPVIPVMNMEPISFEQKLTPGKIHENYMLENISKVLRKPIIELKSEGITTDEVTVLKRNNIEIEDVKPFVKILKENTMKIAIN